MRLEVVDNIDGLHGIRKVSKRSHHQGRQHEEREREEGEVKSRVQKPQIIEVKTRHGGLEESASSRRRVALEWARVEVARGQPGGSRSRPPDEDQG